MIIEYETTGSIDGFKKLVTQIASNRKTHGILSLSCDKNNFSPNQINPILQTINIPVIGGIFPTLIHGNKLLEKGNIVIGLDQPIQVHTIEQLSTENIEYEDILDEKIPQLKDGRTMIVFVDGFAKRINAFIDSLFSVFGMDINYIGGGAGSLIMEQKPCLYTNQGLIQDCAVVGLSDAQSGIGVNHGWKVLEGPFKVTESDHNTIKTLDWQPAFDVYHQVVEAHAGKTVNENNFFEVSKAYPFGIARMNNEQIVRDPVQVTPDKHLVCVGEVPEGSFVSILNGDNDSLIRAAGKAVKIGIDSFPEKHQKEALFIIDCISRVLFLENQFELELKAVSHKDLPLFGACTLGEIANSGNEFLEFYNKTNVVAVLGK